MSRPVSLGPPIAPLAIIKALRWAHALTDDEIAQAIRAAADEDPSIWWPDLDEADADRLRRQALAMTRSRVQAWRRGDRQATWLEVRALIKGLYLEEARETGADAATASEPAAAAAPAPVTSNPPEPPPPAAPPAPSSQPVDLSDRDQEIIRLRQAKMSAAAIAERIGMSASGTAKAARRLGYGSGRIVGDPERDARIVALHHLHFKSDQIAKRVGMSARGVRDVLDRLGIKWRSES